MAARLVLEHLSYPMPGVELELDKGLPLGSGLGSSGASAAAAAQAVNQLCGAPLSPGELVGFCAQAEAAACGAAHPDNVAPSLLGGVTLVRAMDDVVAVEVAPSLELTVALVTPARPLPTRLAREAIPAQIPLAQALHNMAHLGALICALQRGDGALLARSLSDQIAEPRRAPLIEGFAAVKQRRSRPAPWGPPSPAPAPRSSPCVRARRVPRPLLRPWPRPCLTRPCGHWSRPWLDRVPGCCPTTTRGRR